MTIRYSEMFYSIQGEGHHTGIPTVWLRLFSCNLQCNGFGQKNPSDPSTYAPLPYKEEDLLETVNRLEDLPVFERGCDSSYSWSSRFKHLQHEDTAKNIARQLVSLAGGSLNSHYHSGQPVHLCFTGGEPLLKQNQKAIVAILKELKKLHELPESITFETNGTQMLEEETIQELIDYSFRGIHRPREVFFSVSPKLFSVSGEPNEKAIKPEVVRQFYREFYGFGGNGQLKFVINGSPESWEEMEKVLDNYRDGDVSLLFPVWVMPVGSTVAGQKNEIEGHSYATDGEIAQEAIKRGYNVSARVHSYLWDNPMGV